MYSEKGRRWVIRPRNDQALYIRKMLEEGEIKNESEALRQLIDGGIARREEAMKMETLLKVCVQQLTLLRRMAGAVDKELIAQSKADAEKMLSSLTKEELS